MTTSPSPEAILVQIKGKIVRANPRALELVGAGSLSDLVSHSVFDLFDPKDRARPPISGRTALKGKDLSCKVCKLTRLDGKTMMVKALTTALEDQGAASLQVVLEPFPDRRSTERRKETVDVLQAKREWEGTFDSVPELIAVLDMDGAIRRVNRALARRAGLTYRQTVGLPFRDIFGGLDLPEGPDGGAEAGKACRTISAEGYLDRLGGYFMITCSPFWDSGGRQDGWVLVARDITKRRRAEDALTFERNRLLSILDAMQDGVAIIDTSFRIEYLNPTLVGELGQVNGRECHQYFHDQDHPCPWCRFAEVSAGKSCQWECFLRKNNKTYDLVTTPFVTPEGKIWQLVIMRDVSLRKRNEEALRRARRDLEKRVEERTAELREINQRLIREITERRLAEEELEAQQRQLRQADKMAALGTVVSGVAHEISNPNNFIMVNAPLLGELWLEVLEILEAEEWQSDLALAGSLGYEDLRERVPLLCQGILDGSKRIRNIVKELKEFSRSERLDLARPVDINQVIEAAVNLLQHNISKATRKFTLNREANLPRIKGYFQRLEQVLINLILNACQALPDPDQAVTVASKYDPESNQVMVVVTDQGIGIPAEEIALITDPFFTTKRHMGGTGLGLAVSSRIVADHGGRLEFNSEPGQMTEARVILPVEPTVEGF